MASCILEPKETVPSNVTSNPFSISARLRVHSDNGIVIASTTSLDIVVLHPYPACIQLTSQMQYPLPPLTFCNSYIYLPYLHYILKQIILGKYLIKHSKNNLQLLPETLSILFKSSLASKCFFNFK